MVRLSNLLCLVGVAAASAQYDQQAQNRDATCDNNCFLQFFTNKCNADNPACVCTLNDMRADYFCCLAKNCLPHVMPDAIERASTNCDAYNKPFGSFDAEAACGIKLAAPTTSAPSKSTPGSKSAASSSSGAVASSNTVVSSNAVASSSAAVSSTPISTPATSPNASASSATVGSSPNATRSTGAATTTNPPSGSGSRATLQGVSVVFGLVVLVAALL